MTPDQEFPWAFLFPPRPFPNVIIGRDPGDEDDGPRAAREFGPWTEPTPPPPPPDECYCTILPADGVVAYAEPCRPCRERVVAEAESFLA